MILHSDSCFVEEVFKNIAVMYCLFVYVLTFIALVPHYYMIFWYNDCLLCRVLFKFLRLFYFLIQVL